MFSLVFLLSMNTMFLIHFSKTEGLEKEVAYLTVENEKAYMEMELQEIEMQEFKVEVAAVLPQYDNSPKHYQGRQLASVLGGYVNPRIDEGLSKILLQSAKNEYNEKNFIKAKTKLIKYISKYPHSAHLPESYLMLINIEFKDKNYEKTITHIDHLISAYPANELTAHAMLVLGTIMERQERIEEASELYRTIIDAFNIKQIQKKARFALKEIGLE